MESTVDAPAHLDEIATVLAALADPTRLGLFRALLDKERCVRDLVEESGLSQPLVSHHLGVLAGAGLATARRRAGYRLYAVSPEGLARARQGFERLLDPSGLPDRARPGGNDACCREEC